MVVVAFGLKKTNKRVMNMKNIGLNNESFRKEWLEKTLAEIPSKLKILDAGAGELANRKYCTHLEYVSQDFCQYDGKGDNHALQPGYWDISKIDIVSDIAHMPIEDNSFDVVLCSEVLEHLPNPESAISELIRVLKPGGKIILTAPFCSLTHFAPFHFSTGFNRYFYKHHLENLQCEIIELIENGNFFECLAQEVHRVSTISNKYAKRKLSIIERIAQKILLRALAKASIKDLGSKELLCYGYQVVAIKK